jgi:protein-S-isoprenylcysteine O-methyltransferase Ste14
MNLTAFDLVIQGTISIFVTILFTSIFFDFILFSRKERVRKEKKSIVETGTMTLFFIAFLLIVRSGILVIEMPKENMKRAIMVLGTLLIGCGCLANILGRINLGRNWANHIKIYDEHRLVKWGVYRIVRHPLYSSIMLMFFGGCLVYRSLLGFLAVVFIFIPFMYYRGKQEEELLSQTFGEYADYKKSTGMFFPKIFKGRR